MPRGGTALAVLRATTGILLRGERFSHGAVGMQGLPPVPTVPGETPECFPWELLIKLSPVGLVGLFWEGRGGRGCIGHWFPGLPGCRAVLASRKVLLPAPCTLSSKAVPAVGRQRLLNRGFVLKNCLQPPFEGPLCSALFLVYW